MRHKPLPIAGGAAFVVLGAVGAVLIAAGWYQAAGTVVFGDQVRSGVLASVGLAALTGAVALWTLAGRRAVEQRLAWLVRSGEDVVPPSGRRPTPGLAHGDRLVATASMRLYHRPSCSLADGKPVRPAGRAEHEAAGRRPCGVCRP